MAAPSSILAWRIPWTEEPGGLQSAGSQRVGHDWSDWACMHAQWNTPGKAGPTRDGLSKNAPHADHCRVNPVSEALSFSSPGWSLLHASPLDFRQRTRQLCLSSRPGPVTKAGRDPPPTHVSPAEAGFCSCLSVAALFGNLTWLGKSDFTDTSYEGLERFRERWCCGLLFSASLHSSLASMAWNTLSLTERRDPALNALHFGPQTFLLPLSSLGILFTPAPRFCGTG